MSSAREPPAIIPSLDLSLEKAKDLLSDLGNVYDKLGGIKIGSLQAMEIGLGATIEELRAYTKVPIIYDHQKACTDIPSIVEKQVKSVASFGINGFIGVPQGAGSKSLESFVKACNEGEVTPIVLLEMTHPGADDYLKKQVPKKVFDKAIELGVECFVVPGNKTKKIEKYRRWADKHKGIKLMSPGIGSQGGSAREAVKAGVDYPIVGRAIYNAEKPAEVVKEMYEEGKKGYKER